MRCSGNQAVQALEGTQKKILPHNRTKNTVLRGRNQGLLKNPPQDGKKEETGEHFHGKIVVANNTLNQGGSPVWLLYHNSAFLAGKKSKNW